jgi:D-tyrosyl-tRNA(Tyr) deacylase
MRAVSQRVSSASVEVNDQVVASIGSGLLILAGMGHTDTAETAFSMAQKIARLRIFSDSAGKMNLSVQDTQGEVLVVSQFTLFADARKGNRPSFTAAMEPGQASILVDHFADALRREGLRVSQGIFGADMKVRLLNDGPVTIQLEN